MINKSIVIKNLFLLLMTIVTLIILKINPYFKNLFYQYVYEDNLSFATINNWYQTKFGNPLPFSKYFDAALPVFEEKIKYNSLNRYKDGISLEVGYDYLVPALDGGIVIFIGQKDGYGNTVIIQQEDGVDVWYSNLSEINLKLYDYIKKGTLVGKADETIYLVFIKDGELVDYQKYI